MDNACDKGNDALKEVTHTLGSFLKTVNGLTQYADQWIDTSRNLIVDITKKSIDIKSYWCNEKIVNS